MLSLMSVPQVMHTNCPFSSWGSGLEQEELGHFLPPFGRRECDVGNGEARGLEALATLPLRERAEDIRKSGRPGRGGRGRPRPAFGVVVAISNGV